MLQFSTILRKHVKLMVVLTVLQIIYVEQNLRMDIHPAVLTCAVTVQSLTAMIEQQAVQQNSGQLRRQIAQQL